MSSKHNYDKALFRLISILQMLQRDELPSLQDLATEFNVTTRTIQKDIYQRLSSFDIVKNKDGRFMFDDSFSLYSFDVNKLLSQKNPIKNKPTTNSGVLLKMLLSRCGDVFGNKNKLASNNTLQTKGEQMEDSKQTANSSKWVYNKFDDYIRISEYDCIIKVDQKLKMILCYEIDAYTEDCVYDQFGNGSYGKVAYGPILSSEGVLRDVCPGLAKIIESRLDIKVADYGITQTSEHFILNNYYDPQESYHASQW